MDMLRSLDGETARYALWRLLWEVVAVGCLPG